MWGWVKKLTGRGARRGPARRAPARGHWLADRLWGAPAPAPVRNARMLDELRREEAHQAREEAKRAAHIARLQALERRRDHALAVAQARALGQPPPDPPRIMRGGPAHGQVDPRRAARSSSTARRNHRPARAPGARPVKVKAFTRADGVVVKGYRRALPGQGKG